MQTNFGTYVKKAHRPHKEYDEWAKDKSEENFTNLMKSLQPTITSALRSYAHGDANLSVRANILAAQAVTSYDPSKGADLKTHTYNTLKRLRRYSAQRREAIHLPENIRLDGYAVKRFSNDFIDKYQREPNLDEISDSTGLSQKRITKTRHMDSEVPQSKFLSESGDILTSSKRNVHDIWQDYVYHDLNDLNKKIFEWTTGYQGSKILPKKTIAQNLKITPAAVSGRINTIAKRLSEVND